MSKVVAIANDHAGLALKQALLKLLASHGANVLDLGAHTADSVDYPDYGNAVARAIIDKKAELGIAICGSGVGISIAANRHAGIRAALCNTGLVAELARKHNDANVLCLGARLIGEAEAAECVIRFLTTEFEGGRHTARVEKLG